MRTGTKNVLPVGLILLGVAALCALLLALPGQTVTTKYLNDLFIPLDGAYRIASGQVPNRDFHTALGPLALYLPAIGYGLSGTLGGAMPVGMALITLALALPLAHILSSRMRPVIALPFGIFLLLIVAVPINLGESITSLTFAKYYNRTGWVALGALLVMYLQPERPHRHQGVLDTLCATVLTVVMIYTKITYGLVALAFLVFMLLDPRQRRWAAGAMGLTLLAGLLVEAFWQSSMAYWSDIRQVFEVGGPLRGTWGQIVDHILGNFADYILLILFAGMALWRTRSIRDALFYGFCAVAGFFIINHNFQYWGIITLHAVAAVAAETILRTQPAQTLEPDERRWSIGAGVKLLFLALVLPTIIHCTAALGLHTVAASTNAGEAVALPNLDRVRLANFWTWGDHEGASRYLTTIQQGADALSSLAPELRSIVVLDLANPFSMILDIPPPKGDAPWLQWDRTVSGTSLIPAEEMLADAQVVMEPKIEKDDLQALYRPYLSSNFDLVSETEHWKVHRRSPSGPRTISNEARRP